MLGLLDSWVERTAPVKIFNLCSPTSLDNLRLYPEKLTEFTKKLIRDAAPRRDMNVASLMVGSQFSTLEIKLKDLVRTGTLSPQKTFMGRFNDLNRLMRAPGSVH